jgi:hypothetical protein
MWNVQAGTELCHAGNVLLQEFKHCLQKVELSLTRKDINLLMSKVDVNGDGMIDYREFVPLCFGILVERFADQVINSSVLESEDGMRAAIMQCLKEFDVEGVLLLCQREDGTTIIWLHASACLEGACNCHQFLRGCMEHFGVGRKVSQAAWNVWKLAGRLHGVDSMAHKLMYQALMLITLGQSAVLCTCGCSTHAQQSFGTLALLDSTQGHRDQE